VEEICKNWSSWLAKTRFSHLSQEQREQTLRWLLAVRDIILEKAQIVQGDKVVDIGTGTGLLGFGVIEKFHDKVELIFSDKFEDCLDECKKLLEDCNIKHDAHFLQSDACDIKIPDGSVDKALMRSVLVHILDKQKAIDEIYRILKTGGTFCAFEPIISSNTRYHELINAGDITDFDEFKKAEDDFMSAQDNPLTNFNQHTLAKNLECAGFKDGNVDVQVTASSYAVDENAIDSWFTAVPSPGQPSMKDRFLEYFDEEKVNRYIEEYKKVLNGKTVTISSNTVFIKAVK